MVCKEVRDMKYVIKVRKEEDDGEIEEIRVDADYHIVQGSRMIFMSEDEEVLVVNLDRFVDLDIDIESVREPEFGVR